jgi:hypothetical protein
MITTGWNEWPKFDSSDLDDFEASTNMPRTLVFIYK